MSDRQKKIDEARAARLGRAQTAKARARELGTKGSFAILAHDDSRIDPRTGEPRAIWFSEYELLDAHIRVHRHSSVHQEWQQFLYTAVWAAADASVSEVLGLVKDVPARQLLDAMRENNGHVTRALDKGTMGVGIAHSAVRNRQE